MCENVEDYRLAFNLAVKSLSDPSFANIVPAPGEEVHGIAIVFNEAFPEKRP